MGLELRQGLSQRYELRQQQVIELSHLMAVPDEVLTFVADYAAIHTEQVEGLLRRRKEEKALKCKEGNGYGADSADKRVQSLYSDLSFSSGLGKFNRSGIIAAPDVRVLNPYVESSAVALTSDVTYVGRKDNKPAIIFSDHLKGREIGLYTLQIESSQYPETAKLLEALRRFDGWKRENLIKAYLTLGEEQREFLENLDKARLHKYDMNDLADKLDLHSSTVSRIFNKRQVEARSIDDEVRILSPKDDLLVTQDDLKRYLILPEINGLLEKEFGQGKAYSDQQLAGRLGSRIARRTITKYREQNRVPSHEKRTVAYKNKSLEGPYILI